MEEFINKAMPRRVSFKPYSITIKGCKKYRVFIPSLGKRDKNGQKRGSQRTFNTLAEARAFAEPYKQAAKNNVRNLENAKPSESIAFQALEYNVKELGYTDLETFIQIMIDCERVSRDHEFKSIPDAIEYLSRNQHYSTSSLTIKKLLELYKLKQTKWNSNDLSSFNSCTKFIRIPAEKLQRKINPPNPKKYPKGYKYLTQEIYEKHAQSLDAEFWLHWLEEFRDSNLFSSNRTYDGMLQNLRQAYQFAVANKQLPVNPFTTITGLGKKKGNPVVVTAHQLRKTLTLLARHHPLSIPYYIVTFYSGARPGKEADRVRYRNLTLSEDQKSIESIQITRPEDPNEPTKTKKNRTVTIESCASAWLMPFYEKFNRNDFLSPVGRNGLPSSTIRKNVRQAVVGGKYTEGEPIFKWSGSERSIARHSFLTYLEAYYDKVLNVDPSKVVTRASGHSSYDTYETYYKNDEVFHKQAADYFSIFPTSSDLDFIQKALVKI